MAQNKPIGKLLEDAGFINEKQIQVALNVQKSNPMFFGEILQDLDFVTSNEIAEAIAMQNGLEYVDLSTIVPTAEALKLVPHEIAKNKNILPIAVENNTLVVAMQDVNDIMTLDYLKKVSSKQVKLVVANQASIARYSEIYYYQMTNPIEAEIAELVKQTLNNKEIDVPHLVDLILNNAIKDRVTDIHITPENSAIHVFYRIDGVLRHYFSLPKKLHSQIVARIKITCNLDISEQRKPQDGSFSYTFLNEDFDLRVSTLPTNYGENIVMRLLGKGTSLFSLAHLGLTAQNSKKVENYFSKPYGIVLIVGPTGSGKTTTLYSALRKVNSLEKNVMTIEDPIEYKFTFIKQTQLHEKAGYTFDAAIRAFMRQDPDVMLVGEIRDPQTAELAVRASITGHLVLSTLHTNDAIGTIPRLIDLKIPPYLIGSGLLGVIAQRLVRKLCHYCKKELDINKKELIEMGVPETIINEYSDYKVYEAVGCQQCKYTGYNGREVVVEILDVDKEIESLITEEASTLELLKVAKHKGMHTMKEDGYIKVLQGITSFSEIDRVID
ncbi:GspE/PulE family protein [Sulfurimonas autotrophica]|uniref:Type II secretion system protein E n=1 Tax=Sulfurimonas autotrophica (strain ATCC BAA-671 / DSM 16294 / JCM 11897 / OK10) TaxID=563040 RepID=E0UP40_SULAO|nr:GspE/PulE family protein [Sulfurimonas autotrophica]ADN08073.1 type II secretion system protein E [Sulfurimonas autotrophica DSM 16294]